MLAEAGEQRLVPEVKAVVGADGDRRARAPGAPAVESSNELHAIDFI
jgi:hypothetical protein